MSDDIATAVENAETADWSCYTTSPAESLALFERARGRCPIAHSDEHDGFYMRSEEHTSELQSH